MTVDAAAMGRILVVDDNAENRALAHATLDDEGIACELAASGEAGLAAFARGPWDCVLLDIRMPGLDGITVCERIRALPAGDRVAIVFLTAQREVTTFDRALAAGGDDFVTKPFRPDELVIRIQTAIRLRKMAAARDELALELKRQRDLLQRLQLQKEQLSEFLVHDLKNPVNSIELHAQRILRNAAADARSRDASEKIHEETAGLMRMITNLLDIGKADEGQLAPARSHVEVPSLVEIVVGELHARAAACGVEIMQRVDAMSANVDRELLLRVLANLLDNALRHAPEASTVTVSGRRDPSGIELRVADQGPGVPADQRAKVFERFVSQGPATMRTNRGLGLAFCRVAVEAHGGRIWVEDAAPGAAFCIALPDA